MLFTPARLTPLLMIVLLSVAPASFSAPPPWLEINSTHYSVITDAGEKKGREIAFRFEQMRAVFSNLLGKDRIHQSAPLTILALNNDRSYYQAAPLHNGQPIDMPGFFLRGSDQDFIVLNMSETDPWRSVAGDFARMLLTYNYPPAQAWFDDGLTTYFSSIRLDDHQVELGGDPFAAYETAQSQKPSEILASQPWLSFPDLFDMSPVTEGKSAALYQAESWAVMHYLLDEKKLPETGTYFGLRLNQRLPADQAIQQAYGMSSSQLEQAVKDYVHSWPAGTARQSNANSPKASAQVTRFPSPIGPEDSAIVSKPISDPEVRAIYAGIQIRIPERRELGLKTLNDLATTPTFADQKAAAKPAKKIGEDEQQLPTNAVGEPVAHRILAWDHIEHSEFDEAFAELRDAAALSPSDMWIRYYLSLAKYRMAQARHNEILGLANMMLDLRSVLEWYPEMASAYDLLAMARNAGGGATAAMQAERAAIGLSPRNETYLYHLAQIYVTSKNWDAATALLDRLKESGNPQIAAQAGDLLTQAGSERKYGIPLEGKAAPQPQFAPQKSPFDVLDQDEAKREAAEKTTETDENRSMKFTKGRLVAVDCSQPPTAILTISSTTGMLKLRASDYRSIVLVGADDFSCDWRDVQVTANYRPSGRSTGELVSLEVH